ncbi:hypothetical protein DICPUDRAFT_96440 [Dictyostelium purpureum]|uniref:Pre-mRNA-processing factor 19 n=1 Tax=Dictyostelium purpureum TaxID=5786 RepID=F0Z8B0_DICPU|nr:uncharacterized protein DICPUDRAFT_96440 [Dictyostelium purpureum]EGC39783.1 hypothetical protein DICPUDRAFT_96440 [Dictyostelium purpureum]|eukprot:XP_003283650.1 hypothetical protein DICPUDRAFT_96440 [Dictyostelium purpureum]
MICSISGSTPEEPVISIKTGNVYEKRLIEKYIDTNGKEPTTGEPLSLQDLVAIKVGKTVKPRPATATSIPSMLQLFQNEWDALMLETYTLKQQHESIRLELAHSMYQYDAACRVIARLVKERDAARAALANVHNIIPQANQQSAASTTSSTTNPAADIEMSNEDSLDSSVLEKITEAAAELIKARKERTTTNFPSQEEIKQFKSVEAQTKGIISSVAINTENDDVLALGSKDCNIYVYHRSTGETVASLKGHSGPINKVLFAPHNTIVSCSEDATIRVAKAGENPIRKNYSQYKNVSCFSDHKASATDISLHPVGNYVFSSSLDKSINMYDIEQGKLLTTFGSSFGVGYTSVASHPDGMFIASGTQNGILKTFDIKSKINNFNFQGFQGSIKYISFSENGYYVSVADDHVVKLYDLRKAGNTPSPDIQTISIADQTIKSIDFDYSSQYLGIATNSHLNMYSVKNKQKPPIQEITNFNLDCLDFKWSRPTSNLFVTSSISKNLINIYSL